MLRLFREVINRTEKNIALAIIENLTADYAGIMIHEYETLLDNLTTAITATIQLDRFEKLKWREQDELLFLITSSLKKLIKNSVNSYPINSSFPGTYLVGRPIQVYKNKIITGLAVMSFVDEGGYSSGGEWDELKFPDVFYNRSLKPMLKNSILTAATNTQSVSYPATSVINVKENGINHAYDIKQYAKELTKVGFFNYDSIATELNANNIATPTPLDKAKLALKEYIDKSKKEVKNMNTVIKFFSIKPDKIIAAKKALNYLNNKNRSDIIFTEKDINHLKTGSLNNTILGNNINLKFVYHSIYK